MTNPTASRDLSADVLDIDPCRVAMEYSAKVANRVAPVVVSREEASVKQVVEKGQRAVPGKRERILLSAEEVFAEQGFAKAKLADIAGLVGIAESSIYDFFESKEDLLLSITEMRLQSHMTLLPETFNIKTPLRKLRRFIRYHFDLYMRNCDFLKIFVMENLLSHKFYASRAFDTFKGYMKVFEDIIEEGKASGTFRQDVNTRLFKNMFLGAFAHMALRWIIFDEKSFDKMREVKCLVDLLCASATPQDSSE